MGCCDIDLRMSNGPTLKISSHRRLILVVRREIVARSWMPFSGFSAPVHPGGISLRNMVLGVPSGTSSTNGMATGPSIASSRACKSSGSMPARSTTSCGASTARWSEQRDVPAGAEKRGSARASRPRARAFPRGILHQDPYPLRWGRSSIAFPPDGRTGPRDHGLDTPAGRSRRATGRRGGRANTMALGHRWRQGISSRVDRQVSPTARGSCR